MDQTSEKQLPLYKTHFLNTLSSTAKSQIDKNLEASLKTSDKNKSHNAQIGLLTKVTSCNDIWTSTQYQGDGWKGLVYKSFYNDKFNEKQFEMNEALNPEIENKKFNMRKTTISEYSNALHNNRVFVNPKFSSC